MWRLHPARSKDSHHTSTDISTISATKDFRSIMKTGTQYRWKAPEPYSTPCSLPHSCPMKSVARWNPWLPTLCITAYGPPVTTTLPRWKWHVWPPAIWPTRKWPMCSTMPQACRGNFQPNTIPEPYPSSWSMPSTIHSWNQCSPLHYVRKIYAHATPMLLKTAGRATSP